MPTYGVTQKIHFCYGHRILGHSGKCAHPHGHNATAELTFESESLNSLGMVIDFGDIKAKMKAWMDDRLDHQMILKVGDPLLLVLKEMKEPVFVLTENPTAEALAKVIFDQAREFNLPIVEVRLFETETQSAVYRE